MMSSIGDHVTGQSMVVRNFLYHNFRLIVFIEEFISTRDVLGKLNFISLDLLSCNYKVSSEIFNSDLSIVGLPCDFLSVHRLNYYGNLKINCTTKR